MANKYIDGFEWIATAVGSAISDTLAAKGGWYITLGSGLDLYVDQGRFGYGKAFGVNTTINTNWLTSYVKTIPDQSQLAEGYTGFAIKRPKNGHPNGWHGFAFFDAVLNTCQLAVTFGHNGVVHVYRGLPPYNFDDLTNCIGISKSGCFDEDVWFYAEAHCVIDNSVGTIEIRINTVPVIQVVSVDTQATSHAWFDAIALICGGISLSFNTKGLWDDHYLNDSSGVTNNSWLGNVRTKTQFMVANGATDNFLIGGSSPAATNWQSVLNQNVDDTKFVYSSNPGDIDLYTPDPIINAPLVHVVQLRSAFRQDDATQRQAKHLLRIAATNYENSTIFYTSEIFAHYFSRWELNPNTGVAFTGADVNGFQVGAKLLQA